MEHGPLNMENDFILRQKNLILIALVLGSLVLLSGTQIIPLIHNPSNRLDSFPPPQNLWVDTLACIAYWDEPAGGTTSPDHYYLTWDLFQPLATTDCTYYELPVFLEYGTENVIAVRAVYGDSVSQPAIDTFTSGYLPIPENLEGIALNDSIELYWQIPYRPDTTPSGAWPYWVHSNFPCTGTPNEYGVETDGGYIYTTQSNGNLIFRYDIDDEILIDSFSINGVSNLRDLAYNDDNGLFYGGDGSHTCYEMDFTSATLLRTFIAPVEIQAIAWDEVEEEGLWACSWSTDIMLFDLSGNLINSIPNPSMNLTGLAYDIDSDGGPFLWGFTDHYGGADLVKITVYPGNIVGHMSVYPRIGGSGPPGGLYVARGVFVPASTTLGGILQNDRIFGLEIFNWNGITPPMVPPNLLGYTLYVDNDSLDYIPFTGEDTTVYYDTNSYPFSSYMEYEVTAMYDMEPYGMPSDTGESYPEGPAYIYFQMYSVFPFEEDWLSGSFAANNWENDDNWEVISQIGNPEPCARFQGDLMTNNYSSELTSTLIHGVGPGTPYIDGCIWLEYDVKLDDNSMTGNESINIEIGNENGWYVIASYDNSLGSFDWTHDIFDITQWSFGQMLRLRFVAEGINSTDINSWYVDNIEIYLMCMPIEDLWLNSSAGNDIEINFFWNSPYNCISDREIQGYRIEREGTYLGFTVDTFYVDYIPYGSWNPPYSYDIIAVYEDCEAIENIIIGPIGIEDYDLSGSLAIYPNPAKDILFFNSDKSIFAITIYDKIGKLALHQQFSSNNIQLNTSHLMPGVYMVQVLLESGEVISRKVIVYK